MSTPITVPDLRPTWDGVAFPGTELVDIATALRQVEKWIDAGHNDDGGWSGWPDRPDFDPIYGDVSLNTGSAGIAWYAAAAAHAARADGDDDAVRDNLARARRAAEHVSAHWRDDLAARVSLPIPNGGTAYYGGLAGLIAVASSLSTLAGTDVDLPLEAMIDELLALREAGKPWIGSGSLMGDGGILITLAAVAEHRRDPRLTEVIVELTDDILAQERPGIEGASSWPGAPGPFLGLPEGFEMEGFELGTVGIGFVFARVAQLTGEIRFVEAAARAAAHVSAISTVVGDAALLPRGSGFSFGYCTGSSGVARMFTAVHQATGDPQHLEWALKYGRGILRSGVPGRVTPGNQYVLHQCCGSAAVLETFIGLWLETRDQLWLDAARAQADDLLIRSVSDDLGRRWYSESHILPAGQLKAEIGHQVGASGIAFALLHLHQVNQAEATGQSRSLPRLPDDPYRTLS